MFALFKLFLNILLVSPWCWNHFPFFLLWLNLICCYRSTKDIVSYLKFLHISVLLGNIMQSVYWSGLSFTACSHLVKLLAYQRWFNWGQICAWTALFNGWKVTTFHLTIWWVCGHLSLFVPHVCLLIRSLMLFCLWLKLTA